VVFSYEYDNNNRLVKQHYGESSDCYEFTYTQSNLIDKIYYINNGVKDLKYTYNYDTINRVTEVIDSNNSSIYKYEYDPAGRVSKVISSDSIVETGYDNLGNVNVKKATF
jgi:YD repeat-containing protein